MKRLFLPVLFIIIITIFARASLYADFYNNRNILIGDRAAMLGGAYTALSEDVSGAYYNPAGIAFIKSSRLSLSANVYSYKNYTRQDSYGSAELKKFESVPTSFGLAFSVDPCTLALGIFQTDNMQFSVLRVENGQTNKIEIDNQSYQIGPSIGMHIGDHFSIGVSVHYYYYQGKMVFTDDNGSDANMKQNQVLSGGVNLSAGILVKFTDTFRSGLRYSAETMHTNGTNTYYYYTSSTDPDGSGSEKGDMRIPHQLAWGIACDVPGSFTITADVICYFPMEYDAPHAIMHTDDPDFIYSERLHFDAALGVEYFLNEKYSLRMGFSTNTSAATDKDKAERINCYTGTIGFSQKSGNFNSGFGIGVMYGTSDWQESSSDPGYPGKWTRLDIKLMLGSTYSF